MFTFPDSPYDFNPLEPDIEARTMEIQHGKNHHLPHVAIGLKPVTENWETPLG